MRGNWHKSSDFFGLPLDSPHIQIILVTAYSPFTWCSLLSYRPLSLLQVNNLIHLFLPFRLSVPLSDTTSSGCPRHCTAHYVKSDTAVLSQAKHYMDELRSSDARSDTWTAQITHSGQVYELSVFKEQSVGIRLTQSAICLPCTWCLRLPADPFLCPAPSAALLLL
jgi:hypothetical protein